MKYILLILLGSSCNYLIAPIENKVMTKAYTQMAKQYQKPHKWEFSKPSMLGKCHTYTPIIKRGK